MTYKANSLSAIFKLLVKAILVSLFCFEALAAKLSPPPLGSASAIKGGTFRYNLVVAPETLNPLTAHDNYALVAHKWITESLLVRNSETYAWMPRIAKSYVISKDNCKITFELRDDVTFHDGSPLTAQDVKFSFDVYKMDLYSGSLNPSEYSNLTEVRTIGLLKVEFVFNKPFFSNLSSVALAPIVPQKIYGNKERISELSKMAYGSGPYKVAQYQVNSILKLERNLNWWGWKEESYRFAYNFDEIIIRFVTEEVVRLQMLSKGELDYTPVSLESYLNQESVASTVDSSAASSTTSTASTMTASLTTPSTMTKATTKLQTRTSSLEKAANQSVFTTQTSLFLNLRLPIFQDVAVRHALQLLLNRPLINERLRGGLSLLATGPWHNLSEYADPTVQAVKFDPPAANEILKKAGWNLDPESHLLKKEIAGVLTPLRFSVMYPVRTPWEKYLTIYQEDLRKAGIELKAELIDWTTFMKKFENFEYEGYIVGRGFPGEVDFDPTLEWQSQYNQKNQGNNISYKNIQVDHWLDLFQVSAVRSTRIRLLQNVYRQVAQDFAQIFLLNDQFVFYGKNKEVGLPQNTYKYDIGIDYWWISKAPQIRN